LGFDQIYIINLERRPDRHARMEAALNDLNLSYKFVKAIDNRIMSEDYLKNLGIQIIPDYKDPYSDRSMNYGEIACFLSHYFIWKEVIID
jgi:collagen beta-1,O-galactosyltransferase